MKSIKLTAIVLPVMLLCCLFFSCSKDSVSGKVNDANNSDAIEGVRPNLVAWYKFTNGNTADYSGNNNHLKQHNVALTTDYMGRPNNAYYFDGSSSFMQTGNSASLNPPKITLMALFKPTGYYLGNGAASRILMKGVDDQSNGDYFLGFYNNGVMYGTYGDNQFQSNGVGSAENALQLNNWYKLVYTYDGSVGKLYINDVLVNESAKTAIFTPNISPLRIGKTGRTDFPYWFNGTIDEIRIYNIALSASQVAKIDAQMGQ